jgi:hypothetical protein
MRLEPFKADRASESSPYVTPAPLARAQTGRLTHSKERALNIPNLVKKGRLSAESSPLPTWHKAAPWLISAATILGLIVVFHA